MEVHMPAALDVDREQVRMLVLAVGVREAARQMGLNEKTVLHWSHTGNWLAHLRQPNAKPEMPLSMQPRSVVSVRPADALQAVLHEGITETKIGFTRYAARMATKAAEHGQLEDAPLYKAVADIHGKMHPEVAVDQSTHLSFFSVAMERPGSSEEGAIDLSDDIIPDPLEGY